MNSAKTELLSILKLDIQKATECLLSYGEYIKIIFM